MQTTTFHIEIPSDRSDLIAIATTLSNEVRKLIAADKLKSKKSAPSLEIMRFAGIVKGKSGQNIDDIKALKIADKKYMKKRYGIDG